MPDFKDKISVIVPAYNIEDLLPKCVESLVAQDYPADLFEIIVVDDGSTDETGKVADDLTREDKAVGIFNLVYQSIGSMSVLTSRICGLNDIVFTGQLTAIPVCKDLLIPFAKLYDVNFIVPDNAVFATAIGSCLAGNPEKA